MVHVAFADASGLYADLHILAWMVADSETRLEVGLDRGVRVQVEEGAY